MEPDGVLLCFICNTFGFVHLLWRSRFKTLMCFTCVCVLHQRLNLNWRFYTPWKYVIAMIREIIVHHSNKLDSHKAVLSDRYKTPLIP